MSLGTIRSIHLYTLGQCGGDQQNSKGLRNIATQPCTFEFHHTPTGISNIPLWAAARFWLEADWSLWDRLHCKLFLGSRILRWYIQLELTCRLYGYLLLFYEAVSKTHATYNQWCPWLIRIHKLEVPQSWIYILQYQLNLLPLEEYLIHI